MTGLTIPQSKVLDFIVEYASLYGCGPSHRTIAENFGWSSKGSAIQHLTALEKKGFIARTRGMAGHIRVIKRPESAQLQEAA